MKLTRMSDAFPISGAPYFFQQIYDYLGLSDAERPPLVLAMDYFYGYSYSKFCSPFVDRIAEGNFPVTQESSQRIAQVLISRFGDNWKKLYSTTTVEYNPVHNYDMTEKVHREAKGTENNTNTKNLTDTTEHGMSNTSNDFIYGFNSSDEQPSNKYTSQDGGTTTVKNTGTDTDAGNTTENEDIERTRAGNIGVTTTQNMLEQERRLWDWNFIERMFKDIDSLLVLRIYDGCQL